jgi:hypothetical protein
MNRADADWLVAFDDLLVERWHRCTNCGRPGVTWARIIPVTHALALAVVLCPRCQLDHTRTAEALEARFSKRYG